MKFHSRLRGPLGGRGLLMEENSGASESDASSSDLADSNPEPESGDPDPDSNSEPSPARSLPAHRPHAQPLPFPFPRSPAAFSRLGVLILASIAANTGLLLAPYANA